MNKFSLITFWLFVVCLVRTSGLEIKTPKCANTPNTWKKVHTAINECQEDVKLKIIEDSFYSNEWDYSVFDGDSHFPFSDGHDDHPPIIDHSSIHDHKPHPHIHDDPSHVSHGLDLDTSVYDHYPQIHDHHPQIHDHHQEDHIALHDNLPQILDHHPQTHDHQPQTHDHQPQILDHHPQSHDHQPQNLEHHPQIHHHPKVSDHHTPIHDSAKSEHFPTLLRYETLAHRLHGHSPKPHHSHDLFQIEPPQLKNPQPFATHQDRTKNTAHLPGEQVQHTISLSDNPVSQDHYIDFNDFRKKRHTNDHDRIHSSTATYHDKRIAGCIMQCIYKKNHAVDTLGWPTLDGLVNFYTEGVNEHGYFMATLRAVDYCLKGSSAKYHVNRRSTPEKGQTCDVAFDVFDCISDQITEYCSSDQHSH